MVEAGAYEFAETESFIAAGAQRWPLWIPPHVIPLAGRIRASGP